MFFRKKKKMSEADREVIFIRALVSDDDVAYYCGGFVPVTPAGRREWLKHFRHLPEREAA